MEDHANTIIESLGVYLPPTVLTTDEVLAGCKKKVQFPLANISGIKSRRVAGQTEYSIDLARKAIIDCFQHSSYGPADIDILICCNISRVDEKDTTSFEPGTSIKLKKEFGLTQALVFDITNACAGMFTGIYLVHTLLSTGAIRRGMVVSGEYITHLTETAQRETENYLDERMACLTLGDAGAAVILDKGTTQASGFQSIDLQTYGGYSHLCIA
ncbi:MAG: hypothetical protein KDC44_15010, partial [Phaeodactylibacter sp.]|nr:hypothetical protein [Phaeodactylibacter sp.]